MLRIATLFLVAALSAALLGFSELELVESIANQARFLFLIFLILFLLSLMVGVAQQSRKTGRQIGSRN